jgi:hypothetical protein
VIKINLCPIDELENPYWFLPEVLTLLIVAVGAFAGVQWYFGTIDAETAAVQAEKQSKDEAIAQLEPDLRRFDDLQKDIADLQRKLAALKQITVSKIARFKPVIVIEHFQNLHPEGLWFNNIKVGIDGSESFEAKGMALDNLLVAELLGAMRATESQEKDASDLRTMVYFNDLVLQESKIQDGASAAFPELKGLPAFIFKGVYHERPEEAEPAAAPPLPAKGGAPPASPPPMDAPDAAPSASAKARPDTTKTF